jgi:hypothetical protein
LNGLGGFTKSTVQFQHEFRLHPKNVIEERAACAPASGGKITSQSATTRFSLEIEVLVPFSIAL